MKTKFGLLLLLFAAVFFSEACEREPGDYRILSRFYGTYECMKIKYHDSTNVIVDVLPIDGDSLVYFREHAKYDFNDVSQLVLVFKAKIDIDGSFVGYNKVVTACSIDDRSYVEGKICRDSINIKMYAYQSNPSLDDSNSRNIVRYEGVLIK